MNNEQLWKKYENFFLNEGLSKNRILKLAMLYGQIVRGFKNKPLDSLTREDIEVFINDLNHGRFKKVNGQNYSGNTKADFKKFIKQFWKWLKGNNEFYPPEVSWIKARIGKDEKPVKQDIMTKEDVSKLANSFNKPELKIFVLLLFDSGFRISEMLSVTKKDLTWEKYNKTESCWWIKCNISKTYVRKIPVPLFTEDINSFVKGSYYKSLTENDNIFGLGKAQYHKYLTRQGESALKRKDIHAHLFRHSSATYYAKILRGDRIKLAKRYGWSFSSSELETYVRMSGEMEVETVEIIHENELVKVNKELNDLKKDMTEMQEQIIKLTKKQSTPDIDQKTLKLILKAVREQKKH